MTRKQLLVATLTLGPALALGGAVALPTPLAAQEHEAMAEMMHSVEYLGGRPNSPFSEAVRVGNVLYLSGKLGTVPGEGLAEGGIVPETEQTPAEHRRRARALRLVDGRGRQVHRLPGRHRRLSGHEPDVHGFLPEPPAGAQRGRGGRPRAGRARRDRVHRDRRPSRQRRRGRRLIDAWRVAS